MQTDYRLVERLVLPVEDFRFLAAGFAGLVPDFPDFAAGFVDFLGLVVLDSFPLLPRMFLSAGLDFDFVSDARLAVLEETVLAGGIGSDSSTFTPRLYNIPSGDRYSFINCHPLGRRSSGGLGFVDSGGATILVTHIEQITETASGETLCSNL